jgi:hypothetical protein
MLALEDDSHGGDPAPAADEPASKAEEAAPARKPKITYEDDPRDDLEAMIDAKRHAEDADTFEDWTNPKARYGQDAVLTPRQDRDMDNPASLQPQEESEETAPQPPPSSSSPSLTRQNAKGETEYLVMEDGQATYVGLDSLRGNYKKGTQAPAESEAQRLHREAQAALAEARQIREEIRSGRRDPADEPPPRQDTREQAPPTDKPSRVELARRIQFGTEDEAADALDMLVKEASAGPRGLDAATLPDVIRSTLREQSYDEKRAGALKDFYDANPHVRQDKYLGAAMAQATLDVMKEDMAKLIAADQGWDESRAMALVDQMPAARIPEAHKSFALKGLTVRDPVTVVHDAQAAIGDRWFQPAGGAPSTPQPGNGNLPPRSQRTQNLPVQPQPRQTPAPQQQPQTLKVQSNAEVLQEEREARGLPAY